MKNSASDRQELLFDLGPQSPQETLVHQARYPVWTENKAQLIQRYLKLFVFITKHGVYIDTFAGPQEPDKPIMWAAKLVLESEPRWFRKFYLFEIDAKKVEMLRELKSTQPPRNSEKKEPKRAVEIFEGDANIRVGEILNDECIRQNEATFALLDQRTFECHWQTIQALANHKRDGQNKIELFYFFPNAWLDRAFSGLKHEEIPLDWWGRADWADLKQMKGIQRAELVQRRFMEELGYQSAVPWPIYDQTDHGKVMYYMVHASDHPEAPKLMDRAYRHIVLPEHEFEQLALEWNSNPGAEVAENSESKQ